MYEIVRKVPMPEKTKRQKLPWHEMEVGDSFAIPAPEGFQTLRVRSARVSMARVQKITGFTFTSRKEGEFVRFWRVK